MRILVGTYDSFFSLPIGLLSVIVGVVIAWTALQRWRFDAPIRCAAWVGVSAGLAGAGLFMLLGYLLGYLFTPVASIQR